MEFNRNDTKEKVDIIIPVDKTKLELANYLHASMLSLPISMLQKAIRNNQLLTFPRIDEKRVTVHKRWQLRSAVRTKDWFHTVY